MLDISKQLGVFEQLGRHEGSRASPRKTFPIPKDRVIMIPKSAGGGKPAGACENVYEMSKPAGGTSTAAENNGSTCGFPCITCPAALEQSHLRWFIRLTRNAIFSKKAISDGSFVRQGMRNFLRKPTQLAVTSDGHCKASLAF